MTAAVHLFASKSISRASSSDMSGRSPLSPIALKINGTRAGFPLPTLHAVARRCWHTAEFAEICFAQTAAVEKKARKK